jgi:hypothetical protein
MKRKKNSLVQKREEFTRWRTKFASPQSTTLTSSREMRPEEEDEFLGPAESDPLPPPPPPIAARVVELSPASITTSDDISTLD